MGWSFTQLLRLLLIAPLAFVVSCTEAIPEFFGDSSVEGEALFSLRDTTTSSDTITNSLTLNLSINDSDVSPAKWCVTESATVITSGTDPCTAGIGNGGLDGSLWNTGKPTQATIGGGDGNRTVYLTIADSSDNIVVSTLSAQIELDQTVPGVSSTTDPAANMYILNDLIRISVNYNEAVIVDTAGGTPYIDLNLNTGLRSAVYSGGTGTATLNFDYTVSSGDLDDDATGVIYGTTINLNSGTIEDAATNAAALAFAAPSTASVDVDGVIPTVTFVASSSAAGPTTFGPSASISIEVFFSENISLVSGTPTMALMNSGTVSYSAAGANSLNFLYTVGATGSGEDFVDLDLSVTSLGMTGVTLQDANGNTADVTLPLPASGNQLDEQEDITIDTTGPTVQTISSVNADTVAYGVGTLLTFDITFDEVLTYTSGSGNEVELDLNSSATAMATFNSQAGSNLTLHYTVAAGENALPLDYDATNSLRLVGGTTITDAHGNNAVLTMPAIPASSLASVKNFDVDTTAPTISSVTPPGDTTYVSGQNIDFIVNYDEIIDVVIGTPRIQLDIGGTTRYANYISGATSANLVFRYTVVAGDNDLTGILITSVPEIELNGGSIVDDANNNADLDFIPPVLSSVLVDTSSPQATSFSVPANATYIKDDVLNFVVTFDEAPVITVGGGSVYLDLNVNGVAQADYVSTSGNNATFSYTVPDGVVDNDGIAFNSNNMFFIGGATFGDVHGNMGTSPYDLSSGSPPSLAGILVDGDPPDLTLVSTPPSQTFTIGEVIDLHLTYDQAVTVTGGPPQLPFEIGPNGSSTTVNADYTGGSGSTFLTFSYTVQAGHEDTDGIQVQFPINLNGGTMLDVSGNVAELDDAPSLKNYPTTFVDGIAPVLSSLVPAFANSSDYTTGTQLDFIATFTEPVDVEGGVPRVQLEIGPNGSSTTEYADYISGTTTASLTFRYTVQAGDSDSDNLQYVSPIDLNGASIEDMNDNDNSPYSFTPNVLTGVTLNQTSPYTPFYGILYAATGGGMSISQDGGVTFTNVTTVQGLGNNFVNNVMVNHKGTIFASTAAGGSVSHDDNLNYTNHNSGNYTDVTEGDGWLLVSTNSGAYKSNTGMSGLSPIGSPIPGGVVNSVAHNNRDDKFYMGHSNGTVYESFDLSNNANWTAMPLGASPGNINVVRYLDGGDEGLILVGTNIGFFVSTNGGGSFTRFYSTHADIDEDDVQAVGASHAGTYFFGTNGGLYISYDAGATWTKKTSSEGLASNNVQGISVADNEQYFFVATDNGLSLTSNGGTTFVTKNNGDGLGNGDIQGVTFSDPESYFALTTAGPARTDNFGHSFVSLVGDLPGGTDYKAMWVDTPTGYIYIGKGTDVYESRDGGATYASIDSHSTVNDVFMTLDGLIFVATNNGVRRRFYDGTWATFLAGTRINKMMEHSGEIYAAAADGLHISYDNGATYSVHEHTGNNFPGGSDDVTAIHIDRGDGYIYLKRAAGADRFIVGEPGTWNTVSPGPPNNVNDIYVTNFNQSGGNDVWVSTVNGGVEKSTDGGNTFSVFNNATDNLPSDITYAIRIANGGMVLAATAAGVGMSREYGSNFLNRTTGLPGTDKRDIYAQEDHLDFPTVLAGTNIGGTYSDDNGNYFAAVGASDDINEYFFGEDAPVFVATDNNGLAMATSATSVVAFGTGAPANLPSLQIYSVFHTKEHGGSSGRVYIGTANGLSYNDDLMVSAVTDVAGAISGRDIYSIFVDEDDGARVWVATDSRLYHSADGETSWTNVTTGITETTTNDMFIDYEFDGNRRIYVATANGLFRATGGGTSFSVLTTGNGLGSNDVREVFVDHRGWVWAATAGGLSKSTDGGTTFTNYTTGSGLASDDTRDVMVTIWGQIYVATAAGLSISYDRGFNWVTRGLSEGLPSLNVKAVWAHVKEDQGGGPDQDFGAGDENGGSPVTIASNITDPTTQSIGGRVMTAQRRITDFDNNSGQDRLTVSSGFSGTEFAVNDEIMWVVMGAGNSGACVNERGMFGFSHITSIDSGPDRITIDDPIFAEFNGGPVGITSPGQHGELSQTELTNTFCHVMISRVPNYQDLIFNASRTVTLTPFSWATGTGGVFAIRVAGTLTMNAGSAIVADSTGYQGGGHAGNNGNGVHKGDGFGGRDSATSTSTPNFNGGGGATSVSGAGGANAGDGGDSNNGRQGGNAALECGGSICQPIDDEKVFAGGGGGSTGLTSTGSYGGTGGGIIMIFADNISGSGSMSTNGGDGADTAWDGAGGAGGTIFIDSNNFSGSISLHANGGNGHLDGSGGGGGGRIHTRNCSGGGPSTETVGGGSGPAGGAQDGSVGLITNDGC